MLEALRETVTEHGPAYLALGGLVIGLRVRRRSVFHELLRHGLAERYSQLRRLAPIPRLVAGGGYGARRGATASGRRRRGARKVHVPGRRLVSTGQATSWVA